jgi:hypothetical protein
MARKGAVSCLSGRTVAYRRSVALEVLPELVNETFFGRPCVSGDDGRLTWLVHHGLVQRGSTVGQVCFGFEIVSTNGSPARFKVDRFSISSSRR